MGLLDRIAFRKQDVAPPEAIDVTVDGEVRILWTGGPEATVPAARLRDLCPCAGCVEEGTGRKILDPADDPRGHPARSRSSPVGNYAIQITWSDGHSTGIYSWQTLRDACGLPDVP